MFRHCGWGLFWRWFGWQVTSSTPAAYPRCTDEGGLATVSRPFGTLDSKWLAFETLAKDKTPATNNGEKMFFFTFRFGGCMVIRPVGAPARQQRSRPGPDAFPVACLVDGIAQ